ncbi:MAG: hypothetical protein ACKOET_18870, partial [Verrucomicrobiota bacterium]
RDRMLVQASGDRVSTFQAYAAMGLRKDYRNYEDVAHVCQILGLARVRWILLTNNPDKVAAMRAAGLRVARAEPLEFEPSPFNLAYLSSKAASGHRLHRPGLTAVKSALPPEPVEPFAPHALAEAKRFVYVASYFLPMKPVDHEVLLTEAQYREHRALIEAHRAEEGGLVRDCYLIRDNRFILQFDPGKLRDLRQEHPRHPMVDLLTIPYWFRVHVYFDIVTSQEWVVLTHGRAKIYDLPVVRLHSESLFNRFPLTNMDNRDKFKRSVRHIVHYGVGAITLLYFDGRGAGFWAHATDRMLTEGAEALSSDEAYRKLGVGFSIRLGRRLSVPPVTSARMMPWLINRPFPPRNTGWPITPLLPRTTTAGPRVSTAPPSTERNPESPANTMLPAARVWVPAKPIAALLFNRTSPPSVSPLRTSRRAPLLVRSRSPSTVIPSKVFPCWLPKTSRAPPPCRSVPPRMTPPSRIHDPVFALSSRAPPSSVTTLRTLTVPPVRWSVPRLARVKSASRISTAFSLRRRPVLVKVPPTVRVPPVAATVPALDQLAAVRDTFPPLRASTVPPAAFSSRLGR